MKHAFSFQGFSLVEEIFSSGVSENAISRGYSIGDMHVTL